MEGPARRTRECVLVRWYDAAERDEHDEHLSRSMCKLQWATRRVRGSQQCMPWYDVKVLGEQSFRDSQLNQMSSVTTDLHSLIAAGASAVSCAHRLLVAADWAGRFHGVSCAVTYHTHPTHWRAEPRWGPAPDLGWPFSPKSMAHRRCGTCRPHRVSTVSATQIIDRSGSRYQHRSHEMPECSEFDLGCAWSSESVHSKQVQYKATSTRKAFRHS